ncbi:MAG: hypothetical protein QMD14_01220 [Candidatus Aenigmarchaeota archaeon]|nr:hypothetical protein [Candidatus Aenigmarchaeota archaeon]
MKYTKLLIIIGIIGCAFIAALLPLFFAREGIEEGYVNKKSLEVEENFFYRIEAMRIPAFLEISSNRSRIGISTDPFELQFGILPINITAKKVIMLNNGNPTKVKIRLIAHGNITPFLAPNNLQFILEPSEGRNITITGGGEEVGKYVGEVRIITKIPKNEWSRWLVVLA